ASGIRFGWAAMVAPLVMGLLMAVLFNPLMAAFALCSPVMMAANWIDDRFRMGRQRRANAVAFRDDLARFETELAAAATAELARSLLVQAAVHHGPAELSVAVGPDDAAGELDWIKWLPHVARGGTSFGNRPTLLVVDGETGTLPRNPDAKTSVIVVASDRSAL